MVDWTQVLMALAVGFPATIAAIGALIVTVMGTIQAATTAKENKEHTKATAENLAVKVEQTADTRDEKTSAAFKEVKSMLNGAFDQRIRAIVKGEVKVMQEALKEHEKRDTQNMQQIVESLGKLAKEKQT